MNEKEKNAESFVFYPSFAETVNDFPEEIGNKLLRAIVNYGTYGIMPDDEDYIIKGVMRTIKRNIDKAKERYAETVANGEKGGRPRKYDYDEIIDLYNEGLPIKAIAEKLNTTKGTINSILYREREKELSKLANLNNKKDKENNKKEKNKKENNKNIKEENNKEEKSIDVTYVKREEYISPFIHPTEDNADDDDIPF
ncbi:MAG: helix-turn-helix domain-containing protein [Clostridia bacterium]|nr:helix-turn-helix domain-containing protein [Clostridia bacterium]